MINPGVPIPNAAVHGLNDSLATSAPNFAAVAQTLTALPEGRLMVSSNT